MRAAVLAFACALGLVPATVRGQVTTELFVSGLDSPVALVADPVDSHLFFIVEQRGVVKVVREGRLLDTPFVDLRDGIASGGERGLLGLAVEPSRGDASGSIGGRVFVNFTNREGHTVIARFRRSSDDLMAADVSSRHDLVWPNGRAFIDQPFSNHNGGHLTFGPDGYLYVGLGDGGSGGDPMHQAQDPRSLLGKMLRLDVGVPDDDRRGYRVPADNPFTEGGRVPALAEIWAFGLRNPWRYAFDEPAHGGTGALFIGDVGQSQREEVDYQPAGVGGLNYGWRLREGALVFDDRRPAAYEPLTPPIHDYDRALGQAITGGFVYRGAALDPSWRGRYLFADFSAGRVLSLAWRTNAEGVAEAFDVREHTESLGGTDRLGLISSFGMDTAAELYLLNHSAGEVWKLVPDLSLVPLAPVDVRMEVEGQDVRVSWTADLGGVSPDEFRLEITAVDGLRLLRTLATTESEASVTFEGDERCLRVRGVSRDGSGPPGPLSCLPHPNLAPYRPIP